MDIQDCVFYFKTTEAHVIKILFELLQANVKQASFQVYPNKFYLCTSGLNGKTLLVLSLLKENFKEYKCVSPMHIGLNLVHIYKHIKSIKKKDSIIFSVKHERLDPQNKRMFNISIIPHENTRVREAKVHIQNISAIPIEIPEEYDDHCITVSSSDYQKMCKELNDVGKNIQVMAKDRWLEFSCDADEVFDQKSTFGVKPVNTTNSYKETFPSIQLSRIIKMSGLCKNIQIYPCAGMPLKIVCKIGELGTLEMYLLSVDQYKLKTTDVDEKEFS